MLYKDLNLKKIRQDFDIDFAHFTYQPGHCSCCYGPFDQPAMYWKDKKKPDSKNDDYTYLLFLNADNGSGHVHKNDVIQDRTYIEYKVRTMEQLENICAALQDQLGEQYLVEVPASDFKKCIHIREIRELARSKNCMEDDGKSVIELGKGKFPIEMNVTLFHRTSADVKNYTITAKGKDEAQAQRIIDLWISFQERYGFIPA